MKDKDSQEIISDDSFPRCNQVGILCGSKKFTSSRGMCISDWGEEVFIHYGMTNYDFNTFDGWFIGQIGEFILGITTPGINT